MNSLCSERRTSDDSYAQVGDCPLSFFCLVDLFRSFSALPHLPPVRAVIAVACLTCNPWQIDLPNSCTPPSSIDTYLAVMTGT
eukprot:765298-Hanusia_phi.AAC.3